jgi:hypothetical protein
LPIAEVRRSPCRACLGEHRLVRFDADDGYAASREQPRRDAGAAADVDQERVGVEMTMRDDEVDVGGGIVGATLSVRFAQAGEAAGRIVVAGFVHVGLVRA